jgi:phosphoglycerate kinase
MLQPLRGLKKMKSIEEANVSGKKVIVWADLDVPVKEGKVLDDTRLMAASRTLDFLQDKGASILIIGHLGRPKEREASLSFKPVDGKLGEILGSKIELLDDIKQPQTNLAMIENIRFWPEEKTLDQNFARRIADLGQVYVNDCFATSHHEGATMQYLPKFLPSYAGLALMKEIEELNKVLEKPVRPLIAIIGGAKLETKMPAIYNLAKIADKVLVGGKLMFEAERRSLPENVVVAHDDIETKDIGQNSINLFGGLVGGASTIVWNGPMGVFEEDEYMKGTKEVAVSVIESKGYSVVGGGDTIAALNKLGLLDKINFVSMGGGAMLDFLAGKKLPGLEVLEKSNNE